MHSAEGSLQGALAVLDGPGAVSWHFFIEKSGQAWQMVDTDNIARHAGHPSHYDLNKRFWGIENEGKAGEPLTEAQIATNVHLLRWLWQEHGLQQGYRRQDNLFEHQEMAAYFGGFPTACPSGRIPWERLIADLRMEDTADPDLYKVNLEMRLDLARYCLDWDKGVEGLWRRLAFWNQV